MTRDQGADGPPATLLLASILTEIRLLRADLARRPQAGAADHALVAAIAAQVGSAAFSAAELCEHALVVPTLQAAIMAACGAVGARRVGKALRRIEGIDFGGIGIARTGLDSREGIVWQVCGFDTRKLVDPSR